MLGDVVSRPYNGVERAKISELFLSYALKIPYQVLDTSIRYNSLNFGALTELLEQMKEDHLDEMREDTEWEVTDKDIRDGNRPYDAGEEPAKRMDYVLSEGIDEPLDTKELAA
jgi:hypothetical protein